MHASGQPLSRIPVMPVSGPVPEAVPAGIFDRVCRMVQRIKNHPAYTDSIGQYLNIITPADVTDLNSMQPVLRFKIDVGRPSLKWSKGGADATIAETSKSAGSKTGVLLLSGLSIITIIVNGIALSAILFRISQWGISPNRLAVLGGNILILTNLLMVTYRLFRTIRHRNEIENVEKSAAYFLPVYGLWTILVIFIFPVLFDFK
jgi:hypothetical protein